MLHKEVAAYGLRLDISEKEKSNKSTIKSAFFKGNTKEHILMFYADQKLVADIIPTEQIKIKFEIDIDPPPYAAFEHKYQLLPAPYEVQLYDAPSLFAGKLHAVLCRSWKNRVKGRDLYDYIFYLAKGIPVNLPHLQARLIDSGALNKDSKFDSTILIEMLCQRFATIDYESAKNDVYAFIKDKDSLNIWSQDFFQGITRQYLK